MAPSKIHPNAARSGPRSVLVDGGGAPMAIGLDSTGPSSEVIPRRKRPDQVVVQVCQRVYYGVTRPVVRSYKRLPWVTRRTISIGVQLYMVLYIFFTVPLRVAFYYETRSHPETHKWTQELTVFVALDGVADIIGLTQFARFYDLWRTVFNELSTFASLRSAKDRTRTSDTDRVSASKTIVRRLSSANNFQLARELDDFVH